MREGGEGPMEKVSKHGEKTSKDADFSTNLKDV